MNQVLENTLAELKAGLEINHPKIANLLSTIKETLREHPDNVTLLSPEQVRAIIAGLQKITGNVIVEETKKKEVSEKRKESSRLKSLSDDDF